MWASVESSWLQAREAAFQPDDLQWHVNTPRARIENFDGTMPTQVDENERIWNFIAFRTPGQEYVRVIVEEKPNLFIKEEI